MTAEQTGWGALQRLLEQLSPEEWHEWSLFLRQIKGRYDGDDFSKLSSDELNTLSAWADRAREIDV